MRLYRYFAGRFALTFLATMGIFLVLLGLFDMVEQLRRFGGPDVEFRSIAALAALNLPETLYSFLPLAVILTAVYYFLALSRSSELVVTRAAGRSALRSLAAPVTMTFLIGGLAVAVLNPIVAATSKTYDERRAELRQGERSVLSINESGLWLRQGGESGQTVIRASGASLDATRLTQASFFTFDATGQPVQRIEAEVALLREGFWLLTGVKSWPLDSAGTPEGDAARYATLELPSSLTPEQIRDSFGTPSAVPIWQLPALIDQLQSAGFSGLRHQVWLQSELALPVFFVAIVLIAAGFTMRHQRGGRTGVMVLIAVMLSFGLYFLRNFARILGENGDLPVSLAIWAPPAIGISLALGLLLHLEDG